MEEDEGTQIKLIPIHIITMTQWAQWSTMVGVILIPSILFRNIHLLTINTLHTHLHIRTCTLIPIWIFRRSPKSRQIWLTFARHLICSSTTTNSNQDIISLISNNINSSSNNSINLNLKH